MARSNDYLIQEVINRYKSPFYFYDLDAFRSHLQKIKSILDPKIKIWYATKANPLGKILEILGQEGFGADVASLGELHQARAQGLTGVNLIATGPAKSREYLATLLDSKLKLIVLESINQLKDLNELCKTRGIRQEVLLRLQLDWEREETSVLGGESITPFGLAPQDWKEINLQDFPFLDVQGIHCFQWGNILDINALSHIWRKTILEARKFSREMQIELKILDLGGGLGISYSGDEELHFRDVHETLVNLKKEFELDEIWLELGRFAIAKFGSYLTPIIDIKTVRGKSLIITEGGINHLARPALVRESFPCETFQKNSPSKKHYSVHGPLCTALDFLGDYTFSSELKPGDWLKFDRCGAYGFTESMPYFLCHKLPGEAFVLEGTLHVPRESVQTLDWPR